MEQEKVKFPVVIENSPIEFALMGPLGRHRGVLVKSANAPTDLIGYDNPHVDLFSGYNDLKELRKGGFERLFISFFNQPRIYAVRSSGAFTSSSDSRTSHYSFVWHGLCDLSDLEKFEDQFKKTALDINEALKSDGAGEIEWTMSGLIASCKMMERRAQQKKSTWRFASGLYTFIIFVFIVFVIINSAFNLRLL